MKISDRTVGYLSLITLILVITVIAYLMTEAHKKSTTTILVDFKELGSLQPDDLVVVRGYTVGSIKKVEWLGDRARVLINLDEPIVLREGTEFLNTNYAIMGQRRIEITPSKEGEVYGSDHVFTGIFEPGLTEVLRYIEDVNQQLIHVHEIILALVKGDSTHSSAQEIFENVITSLEETIESGDKLITAVQPTINHLYNQVSEASQQIIAATQEIDTALNTTNKLVNEKIQQAEAALESLSDGAKRTDQIIASIEKDSTFTKLLYNRETVDKLSEMVYKTYELVKAIDTKNITVLDEKGNPVKLVTWKRINLVGATAREKARKRGEKGESLPR